MSMIERGAGSYLLVSVRRGSNMSVKIVVDRYVVVSTIG